MINRDKFFCTKYFKKYQKIWDFSRIRILNCHNLNNKIKILKLNVDENPQTPQKFGVRGIPSLMLFKDGNLIDTKVGSLPKNMLESWLESNL